MNESEQDRVPARPRIALVGAGAIGCNVAVDLAAAGHDVTVIDQWPEQVQALRTRGLLVTLPDGPKEFPPLDARHLGELPALRRTFDIALLALKVPETRWHAEFIKPYLAPEGVAVGLQNGMNDDAIAEVLGAARTIGCVVELSAELFSPGETRRKTPKERTWFALGELDGRITPRLGALQSLLSCTANVALTENIRGAKWTKLVTNAMVLAPFAMLGAESYDALQDPAMFDFVRQLGREAIAVGEADGLAIEPIFGIAREEFTGGPDAIAEKLVRTLVGHIGRKSRNAVMQDHLKGRRTETDHVNGLVVERGRVAGIATPANEAVTEITRMIERGEVKPAPSNFALVSRWV